MITLETVSYNANLSVTDQLLCEHLSKIIDVNLPEATNKVWHAHPVWFLDGNPVVGYSKLKDGVKLMFWSGVDFDEIKLQPGSGKFKDASILYTSIDQIQTDDIIRWLSKSRIIQWDYKNIVKRKGKLVRLK
jgi:hypothetical protein